MFVTKSSHPRKGGSEKNILHSKIAKNATEVLTLRYKGSVAQAKVLQFWNFLRDSHLWCFPTSQITPVKSNTGETALPKYSVLMFLFSC